MPHQDGYTDNTMQQDKQQQQDYDEEGAYTKRASAGCLGLFITTGWLMTCIATALAQDDCRTNCADRFRYIWWVIVWAIFHYVILAAMAFTGQLRTYKNAMLAFTVLLTSQMMPVTNLAIRAVYACYVSLDNTYYQNSGSWAGGVVTSADSVVDLCPGDVASELSVAVSGFIIMMMCNFVIITYLGMRDETPSTRKTPTYNETRAPVAA